ncbi:MAG: ABC transporter substrate-binding protein, partial [Thermodesulfobacteriota bacterium]|nr:ABC transporter substrate-binding protein [Thermodesulfobacteriota bacterium]
MKKVRILIITALIVGITGAATSAIAQEKITVLLDWFVNPDHAPLFVALERGYFANHGLDVEMI